jgi:hypothetical protein
LKKYKRRNAERTFIIASLKSAILASCFLCRFHSLIVIYENFITISYSNRRTDGLNPRNAIHTIIYFLAEVVRKLKFPNNSILKFFPAISFTTRVKGQAS